MVESREPLTELLEHLEADGTVPLAWVVAHAPDGDLGPLWHASRAPGVLMQLAAVSTPRRALVCAACACARAVVHFVPEYEERPRRALEVTEAWVRGQAHESAVRIARDAAAEAHAALIARTVNARVSVSPGTWAVGSVVDAANLVAFPRSAARTAGYAGDSAIGAIIAAPGTPQDAVELSDSVRVWLRRPTLEQLRAEYARRRSAA